ncbi:MAG: hypothetical protein CMP09_23740 [Yangia sp.]|nr:hypothetical protein [Salipiger sp.]
MMTRTLIAGAILLLGSVGAQAQTGLTSEMTRVIGALNLREVVIHPDNWGPDITATLPGGARIELDFHRRGSPLEEIESAQNQPFPATEIAALVPEAVRTNPNYPSDGTFEKVEFDPRGIELEGKDGDGRDFEAEFALDGRLLDFESD